MLHQNSLLSHAVKLAWEQWVPDTVQYSLGATPSVEAIVQNFGLTKVTKNEVLQAPFSHFEPQRTRAKRRSRTGDETADAGQPSIKKRPRLETALRLDIKQEDSPHYEDWDGDSAYPIEEQLPDLTFSASTSAMSSGCNQWHSIQEPQWDPVTDCTTSGGLHPGLLLNSMMTDDDQLGRKQNEMLYETADMGTMPLCLRRGQAQLFGGRGCPQLDLGQPHGFFV